MATTTTTMAMDPRFRPQPMMVGSQGATSSSVPHAASVKLPPKPYTEYTIFFRIERAHLLQSSSGLIDDEALPFVDPDHRDPLEFPRPARWAKVVMPPYWYSASHKAEIEKKRKHRKREGRMDLKTLSKSVSAGWRSADKEVVEYCRKIAKAELNRYNDHIMALGLVIPPRAYGIKAGGPPNEWRKKNESTPGGGTFIQRKGTKSNAGGPSSPAIDIGAINAALAERKTLLRMLHMKQLQNFQVATGICGNASSHQVVSTQVPFQAISSQSFTNDRPNMCQPTVTGPNSNFRRSGSDATSTAQLAGLAPHPAPATELNSFADVRRASAPADFIGSGPFDAESGIAKGAGTVNGPSGGRIQAPEAPTSGRAFASSVLDMDGQAILALWRMREAMQRHQRGIGAPLRRADLLPAAPPRRGGGAHRGGVSFPCVPRWEREDSDALLNVLNRSDHSDGLGSLLRDGGGFDSPPPQLGGSGMPDGKMCADIADGTRN